MIRASHSKKYVVVGLFIVCFVEILRAEFHLTEYIIID